LLNNNPKENFIEPDFPFINKPILNGQLVPGETHEILYYVDKNNPLGEPPQNPSDDPQYIMWEEGLKRWLNQNISPE